MTDFNVKTKNRSFPHRTFDLNLATITFTKELLIGNPKPVPVCDFLPVSVWRKGLNKRLISSGAIPGPVSFSENWRKNLGNGFLADRVTTHLKPLWEKP
jgi:hypothetical protein